ncbi:hypothetical protein GCM10010298_56060 [Streptomyces microflavus]|uniref:Uncharacterized protein n=1 Tax=Streptomyces microflavus TaxID=1919 RepID=A0A7J0CQ66_STRMI|nr:hypothetical protein Smic_31960 [Streptomyces microflavus]GGX83514.1 hypothetical protein GCM10010298_56060 [Streptomyces microflavus]
MRSMRLPSTIARISRAETTTPTRVARVVTDRGPVVAGDAAVESPGIARSDPPGIGPAEPSETAPAKPSGRAPAEPLGG